jgi:hypothetical protein
MPIEVILLKSQLLTNLNIRKFYKISQLFRMEEKRKIIENITFELVKKAILNPIETIKFLLDIIKNKYLEIGTKL